MANYATFPASQRHGKRHPLRKTLTSRKRVSRQKSQARFQKIEAKHREKTRRLIQESQSEEYPNYDFPAIRRALEAAIEGFTDMEMREDNSDIRPLPGFSQSETERLLEKVKATMKDLAENAKSSSQSGCPRATTRNIFLWSYSRNCKIS